MYHYSCNIELLYAPYYSCNIELKMASIAARIRRTSRDAMLAVRLLLHQHTDMARHGVAWCGGTVGVLWGAVGVVGCGVLWVLWGVGCCGVLWEMRGINVAGGVW